MFPKRRRSLTIFEINILLLLLFRLFICLKKKNQKASIFIKSLTKKKHQQQILNEYIACFTIRIFFCQKISNAQWYVEKREKHGTHSSE
jgi:hypothetical protein